MLNVNKNENSDNNGGTVEHSSNASELPRDERLVLAGLYEWTAPITESQVRLDQEAELGEILEQDGFAVIRGFTRIGKTSLALSYGKRLPEGQFLYFTRPNASKGVPAKESLQQFGFYKINDCVSDLGGQPLEDASTGLPLQELDKVAGEKGSKVVVCVDELRSAHIFGGPEVFEMYLRTLRSLENIQTIVVVHRGEPGFEDYYKSTFSEMIPDMPIYPRSLTVEETGVLVNSPIEERGVVFDSTAVRRIQSFTGGRAREINMMCRSLFESGIIPIDNRITGEQIDIFTQLNFTGFSWDYPNAYDALYTNFFNPVAENIIGNFKLLSEVEKTVINQMLERPLEVDATDQDVIGELVRLTFIREVEPDIYDLNGDLLKKALIFGLDSN